MAADVSTRDGARYGRLGKYRVTAHIATGGMGAVYRGRRPRHRAGSGPEGAVRPRWSPASPRCSSASAARPRSPPSSATKTSSPCTNSARPAARTSSRWSSSRAEPARVHRPQGPAHPERCPPHPDPGRPRPGPRPRAGHRPPRHQAVQLPARAQGRPTVVKLTDLGLAREVDDARIPHHARAGTTVGTVDYMAPEQARNSQRRRHPQRHLLPRLHLLSDADRPAAVPRGRR